MIISKRLKISYTLLVLIPLALAIISSEFISKNYENRFNALQATVQTKSFTKELYSLLNSNPDSLLTENTLQGLVNLTNSPEKVTAFITFGTEIYISSGNNDKKTPKSLYEQKYANYWNFHTSDGRNAEIFFTSSDYKAGKWHPSVIFMFIFYSILISILSYSTSRKITKPLELLRNAAISITNEEFDIDLTYKAKDEISEVFTAFDDMRVWLKTSAEKQLLYEKNRTELISNISHDLKTPVTAIKGYIEGIVDGVANTPDKINRYHETISKKANLLDKLIDNLFLSSKLDLKAVRFDFQRLDLNLFISDIIEEILYDSPNLKITHTNNDKNLRTLGDPIQLQRVIHNIVGNSLKYNDKEICLVDITLSRTNNMAIISIKDNGVGVSPETTQDIFTKFFRGDPARSSSTEGSGLGLAISKQIITEHKGEIYAQNNTGCGITITFKLPLDGEVNS